MTKKTKGFNMDDFSHVTDALLQRVQHVVNDRKLAGRYSSSLIYRTHNELFKLHEPQQTCPSCLQTRARAIEKWLDWYGKETATAAPQEQEQEQEQEQADFTGVPVTTGAPDSTPVQTEEQAAPPMKQAPQPAQILLQKIDKDDYSKTEGEAFFASFEGEGDKGTVTNADTGKAVQAGTYATDRMGFVLSVQPGGKATYKAVQA